MACIGIAKGRLMTYWWVNQNQTYNDEIRGGYMWSPKKTQNGNNNEFYNNMTRVANGDIVFSFKDQQIKAIGVIQSEGYTLQKPSEFGRAGSNWSQEGWCVDVEYHELEQTIKPKDYIELLLPTLPTKYSPIQKNGDGNQGVYLAKVSQEMADLLLSFMDHKVFDLIEELSQSNITNHRDNITEENLINNNITETEKKQLIKARRGQGVFRTNVERIEKKCRVTDISLKEHLIASHIKPWRDSTNQERLDGQNGFLLAPHVDHLFDKGYITFNQDGFIELSPRISLELIQGWGIDIKKDLGNFTSKQKEYLKYHREYVFKNV